MIIKYDRKEKIIFLLLITILITILAISLENKN